jgi:CelD/BcsL family acetyltransferase involved in cellulose biosynthesis
VGKDAHGRATIGSTGEKMQCWFRARFASALPPALLARELLVSDLRVLKLDSLDQLQRHAAAWDDLWLRSHSTRPVARAATLAHWIDRFAPTSRFCALVVEQTGGRLVAGLPLVGQRLGRVLDTGAMPHNAWSPAGDLLLCRDGDTSAAARALVGGLGEVPWTLLRLDMVPVDTPHWRAFRRALAGAGVPHECRRLCDVGMVDIDGHWADYRRNWSKSHRRNIARATSRLQQDGDLDFRLHTSFRDEAVEPLLRHGFQVEDRSWKRKAGTSVLQTAGMFEFYVGQARLLAQTGHLRVAFLNHRGQTIAFQYCLSAKGTFHSLKAGYDETFARFSPGQLLTHSLLNHLFQDSDHDQVDFMGPMSGAMASWRPRLYPLGRLAIARPGVAGRLMMHAYTRWWPRLRRS